MLLNGSPGPGRAYERETKTPKRIAKRRAKLDSEGYQVRRKRLCFQRGSAPVPVLPAMAGCIWLIGMTEAGCWSHIA